MRTVKNHVKKVSLRALSLSLSALIFVGLFVGVLSTVLIGAKNPTHTGALNTYVPVQNINLMPVEIGLTTYVDDSGDQYKDVPSRTTYSSPNYEQYLNVKVNDSGMVSYTMKKQKPASATDTTYASTSTQVNQMINLQDNPYLMIAWKSNVRVNGFINFTVTKGNKTYYLDTKEHKIYETSDDEITHTEDSYDNSGFTFYQVYSVLNDGRTDYNWSDNDNNNNNNDFYLTTKADYSFDFYEFLYKYFKQNNWLTDYWPDWGTDGNYLTINYVNHTMVSESVNKPLYDYSFVDWTTCEFGRGMLNAKSILTPRADSAVRELDSSEKKKPSGSYISKYARLDDGTYVFRNTSQTESAIIRWRVDRFLNVNELKTMYLDADLTGTDTDMVFKIGVWGTNTTNSSKDHFTCLGYRADLNDMITNYSDQIDMSLENKYKDVVIKFYDEVKRYSVEHGDTTNKESEDDFYPSDQLISIPFVQVTLPPNAKLSIRSFGVRLENEFAPSTATDTVYPWYTSNGVDNLPPKGTPATSSALDSTTGSNSAAYNWAATETPIVENKVDLLSMTDQHIIYDTNGQYTGFEEDKVTGYWRTLDGKSHFTSNTTDLVYREFRRRDPSVEGPSGKRDSNNYYVEIPVGTMPYLYYSYTLKGNGSNAVGFYFNVPASNAPRTEDANGSPHYYKNYYIGQSGLALQQCDNIMSSTSETVGTAQKALCSSAPARTGVIDLRSIGYKDTDIMLIENMRFYVTGLSTEVTFDYLFFGSESLDSSVTSTIAKNSGDAFPWAITHDQFKTATLGTGSQFTFANRINLIDDMIDRKEWHLKLVDSYIVARGYTTEGDRKYTTDSKGNKVYFDNQLGSNCRYDDGEEYTAFGSNFVYNSDGSVTLTTDTSAQYFQAGTSFDHLMSFKIDTADLSDLRYINYSVDAPQGMRWSILFKESSGTTNGNAGVALRTWSDAMMSGDFYGSGSTNAADSKATVGKSYFREMDSGVFHNNWFKDSTQSASNAKDMAWAMFTVPGSETGCFDLSQIQRNISWDTVISIYFIAYRDPSLKTADGSAATGGSVKFNYVYLTSEPVTPSSWGAAPIVDGQSYSWGYKGDAISFKGDDVVPFNAYEHQDNWATDFKIESSYFGSHGVNSSGVLNFKDNHIDSYSLYFSFTFTKRNADGTDSWIQAYPKSMIGFMENGWTYYLYSRRSDFGDVDKLIDDIDALRGQYRHQMPYSGVIGIDDLGLNGLEFIRVYYDKKNYVLHPEYVVVACSKTVKAPTGGKLTLTALESKVADFSEKLYQIDNGITRIVENVGGTTIEEASYSTDKNIVVDLNRTPYLFYSIRYAAGSTGTFALGTDIAIDGKEGFFRDGIYSDIGSNKLIAPGVDDPESAHYLPQSETGCIDVRDWLLDKGALPANGKITIKSFKSFLSGSSVHFHYMYFGAEADKTVDLIPAKAQGRLKSGVSTHSWGYDNSRYGGEMQAMEGAEWDAYIADSRYKDGDVSAQDPSMKAKLPGDQNDDGYNDLRYSDTRWGFYSICYGEVDKLGSETTFKYVTTGNNQTSGLTINLDETPYLHFSISQAEDSYTTFLLQTNDETGRNVVRGLSAEKVRPQLSCYNSLSPAGQLMHIAPQTSFITFYKDATMTYDNGTYNSGDLAGVIDLRRWYTETNGYDDIISLERIRFYTTNQLGKYTDVTVNHMYLSSSSGASYSVMFDKNDGTGTRKSIQVLKNANDQYVSDEAVKSFKTREGYTFVGWYTDPEWEEYFDIKKTPIRQNTILYAGWIKNSDVVKGELNLLTEASKDSAVHILEGNKVTEGEVTTYVDEFHVEDGALHLRNNGTSDFVVKLDVNKAYSLYDARALYAGFDVAKSTQGASIVVDLKSLGSHKYDLLNEEFKSYFLTDNGTLTAAPYDKQLPMYMTVASRGLLPVTENVNGYVYVKSVTFTVPAGEAMHFRYLTTAKSMDDSDGSVVAPSIQGSILDLLDSKGDAGFVEQIFNSEYQVLKEKTEIFGRSETLYQANLSSAKIGYVTLGSLYGLGNTIGEVKIDTNNPQYLYYNINQPDDSRTTFNMWVSVFYTEDGGQTIKTIHPAKWSSFLSNVDGQLHSQDDLDNGSIPYDAFIVGSRSGRINLAEWYSTALQGRQDVSSSAKVVSVRITGVRLYTSNSGTDATFNYLAIGGNIPQSDESLRAKAVTVNANGQTVTNYISDVSYGQTVDISLDQLNDCAAASDPTKEFLGWSFKGNSSSSLVYWNPNAKNDKKYNASSNPNGFWSDTKVTGFVANRRDISYQLTSETERLYPVFASAAYTPDLNVRFDGSGSVTLKHNGTENTFTTASTYSETFGNALVLSSTASNFVGWYGENGQLLTSSRDYAFSIYSDTVVVAKFGTSGPAAMTPFAMDHSHSIVWLQRAEGTSLTAGSSFYLRSLNNGEIYVPSSHDGEEDAQFIFNSNVDDVTGTDEIVCYWSMGDGQYLEAVAPSGYHWEMLLQDGSTVCLGDSNTYRFVTALDMKLICTPNGSANCDESSGVIVNEYAIAYDRTDKMHSATITGQVFTAENEMLVSCGFVMAKRPSGVQAPSYGSPESERFAAQAWNSTTGQFTVYVEYVPSMARYIRGYAIVQNTATGQYSLRYSDYVSVSF